MSERWWYHGKIVSIRRENDNLDFKIVTVKPEWKWNPKTYKVMDIFFGTTDDKIIERPVFVKENTSWELMKVLIDKSESLEGNSEKTEVVFRYDQDALNIYRHVSLVPIKNRLNECLKHQLNLPENRDYIKGIIYGMPSYIAQYGYFEKYTKKLENNPDAPFSIHESEDIHLYYGAYIAAKLIIETKTKKDSVHEEDITGRMYFSYYDKVINKDLAISIDIFEWYVDSFVEEIRNYNRWNAPSLREQYALSMYEYLDPVIKYHFFVEEPSFPLSKRMYNYLSTLYRMNNVYKKHEGTPGFVDTMTILMNLYHKEYKDGLPLLKQEDNMLFFDAVLHGHEVFHPVNGVHCLLDQFFDFLAEHLYEEYYKNIHEQKLSYADTIAIEIRETLSNDSLTVQWFFYCLNILQEIHNNCIANKD